MDLSDVWNAFNADPVVHTLVTTVLFVGLGVGLPLALMGGWRRPKNGVRGTGQVISVSGRTGNSSYSICYMNLVVQAPGLPPTAVKYRRLVSSALWPMPGAELPIVIDVKNPKRFAVLWNEVPTSASTAENLAQFVAEQMNRRNTAFPPADLASQLERLAALRANGVLNEDEYVAERARIVGQSR
ncbi:hypothetical protein B7R54_09130 [Subtercola boreus]|uniref:SHOCT domain-containing protein n=1 Tax=Subtercola boreus TaxID=120213 RepID=A0A3E0VIS9_9MICO|nr:SHOCT domain-containing protein [Subtercola boreus]RFA09378.1 hypothetical protein B7R54_09130 [Subtercola boreus]TQL53586.1 hypothetical protein FB464_1101 [Subtercola boreus]